MCKNSLIKFSRIYNYAWKDAFSSFYDAERPRSSIQNTNSRLSYCKKQIHISRIASISKIVFPKWRFYLLTRLIVNATQTKQAECHGIKLSLRSTIKSSLYRTTVSRKPNYTPLIALYLEVMHLVPLPGHKQHYDVVEQRTIANFFQLTISTIFFFSFFKLLKRSFDAQKPKRQIIFEIYEVF